MLRPALIVLFCVALGLGLGWLVGGPTLWGAPALVWVALVCFAVQWVAFLPAYAWQDERFYDGTGTLTYLTAVALCVGMAQPSGPGAVGWLLAGCVVVWAVRLGTFLVRRILHDGKDGRFDDIKPNPGRFLVAWTLQGLWVFLTSLAATTAIVASEPTAVSLWHLPGLLVWAGGWALEVVADRQKSEWRADPGNAGRFIDVGLWSWSRHPNYVGEIVLWTGAFLVACVGFTRPGQWATLLSPLFVYALLSRVSGVPLLEKRADERWGGQSDYEAYKARTPVLFPWGGP